MTGHERHDELAFERIEQPHQAASYGWQSQQYVRVEGERRHGPASFAWDERQLRDLSALFTDPDSDGPRERLAMDMAVLLSALGWQPDVNLLEDASERGEEVLFTVRPDSPELYTLPWETLRVDASGSYLSDFDSTLLRYSVPGLRIRPRPVAPAQPGVTFAWSSAGGRVPRDAFVEHIVPACRHAGVSLVEIPDVDQGKLEDSLERRPTSVLHILCHGVAGRPGEPPALAWGGAEPIEIQATRLARMLAPYRETLRLVILSACGSGDGGQDALFLGSVAQELHRKGIENVVASRSILSIRGARRMSATLYYSLLVEGWSLERSVRRARAELLRAGQDGRSNAGDAYSLQLYTHAYEALPEGAGTRPVLSSYPFGTPPRPAPRIAPPRRRVQLVLHGVLALVLPLLDSLVAILRRFAEDEDMTVVDARSGSVVLDLETTVDGTQRLMQAWRSGALAAALGLPILGIKALTGPLSPPPTGGGSGSPGTPPNPSPGSPASGQAPPRPPTSRPADPSPQQPPPPPANKPQLRQQPPPQPRQQPPPPPARNQQQQQQRPHQPQPRPPASNQQHQHHQQHQQHQQQQHQQPQASSQQASDAGASAAGAGAAGTVATVVAAIAIVAGAATALYAWPEPSNGDPVAVKDGGGAPATNAKSVPELQPSVDEAEAAVKQELETSVRDGVDLVDAHSDELTRILELVATVLAGIAALLLGLLMFMMFLAWRMTKLVASGLATLLTLGGAGVMVWLERDRIEDYRSEASELEDLVRERAEIAELSDDELASRAMAQLEALSPDELEPLASKHLDTERPKDELVAELPDEQRRELIEREYDARVEEQLREQQARQSGAKRSVMVLAGVVASLLLLLVFVAWRRRR